MLRKMLIDGEVSHTESDQQHDFDHFVIGAGSGGVRASRTSAGYGAKVAICELPFNPISSEVIGGVGGTFQDDLEATKTTTGRTYKFDNPVKLRYSVDGTKLPLSGSKVCPEKPGRSLKEKVLSRVFSEDYESERVEQKILAPCVII